MNSNKKEGIEDGISINKNYHVVIPFDLLEFLSVDYSYKNKRRFSRLQAFQNLIEYYSASESNQKMQFLRQVLCNPKRYAKILQ